MQPLCYLQIQKMWPRMSMNGHSSTAQSAVVTLIISWYMAGHSNAIKRNNTVPGLLIKRRFASGCTESNERTHFIEVLATEAFNKSTVYCAAYERRHREEKSCRCRTDGRCYSKPALLTGEHILIAMSVILWTSWSLLSVQFQQAELDITWLYLCDTMQWEWYLVLLLHHKQLGYQK